MHVFCFPHVALSIPPAAGAALGARPHWAAQTIDTDTLLIDQVPFLVGVEPQKQRIGWKKDRKTMKQKQTKTQRQKTEIQNETTELYVMCYMLYVICYVLDVI